MAAINRDKQFFYITIAMVIVGAVISFGFRFYGERISSFFSERNVGIETVLREFAEAAHKNTPYIIDETLLHKRVYFREAERTIVYEYMFLHDSNGELDLQHLKDDITEFLVEAMSLALIEDIAFLGDQDVIFEFVYFDNQGAEMFRVRLLLNTPITVAGSVNR